MSKVVYCVVSILLPTCHRLLLAYIFALLFGRNVRILLSSIRGEFLELFARFGRECLYIITEFPTWFWTPPGRIYCVLGQSAPQCVRLVKAHKHDRGRDERWGGSGCSMYSKYIYLHCHKSKWLLSLHGKETYKIGITYIYDHIWRNSSLFWMLPSKWPLGIKYNSVHQQIGQGHGVYMRIPI